MRKFQITINLQMFDENKPKELSVYADSNNLWETICAGFGELMSAVENVDFAGIARQWHWKQK